jgi:transglutaminase-like putative cysteine protease
MKFRWLALPIILLMACVPLKTEQPIETVPVPPEDGSATRQYTLHQHLSLVNEGDRSPEMQNLWVALIRDIPPYQKMLSRTISPNPDKLFTDEYGNQYAEFDFSDHPGRTTITVDIEYEIAVNEIVYDLSTCEGDIPDVFTNPELHVESANPQIVSLSKELSMGKKTPCEQVRAFYDYTGNELTYSYNRDDWGAQATLGFMGSDCTEYSSLMMALSRAAGIPARYYEGLLYLEGKNEEIAKTEHAWLDVYLPGPGWVAMDPTLGRSSIYRKTYFAHYTADHIIVTTGRNPSTLRGASYWTHLYWPGDSTTIRIKDAGWIITLMEP